MPKVPISENRIQYKTARTDALNVASLGQAIVGNDVFEAQQGLNRNLGNLGEAAMEYVDKEQKKESEKKILSTSQSALTDLDNLLNDPTADDTGRPKGILNRKLSQVGQDTVVEYDKGVQALKEKYAANLDDKEREKFSFAFDSHARSMRDNVAKHQVAETNKDLDNRFDSNIKLQVSNSANALTDEALSENVAAIHSTVDSAMRAKGMDEKSIQLMKNQATDKAVEANIYSRLEKDPDSAKKTLMAFKDHLSPDFYQKADKEIEGKRFDSMRSNLYTNTFAGMKLSDGEPDIARMEKAIEVSKFDPKQKEELRSYVKSRALEDNQSFHRQEKDTLNRFENEIISGKNQGSTLTDALKVASRYGRDAKDVAEKQDIAKKLYTDPAAKSDPDAVIGIYEKTLNGTISRSEIQQAYQDGKLNASDYMSASKHYLNEKTGETKKEDSLTWQRVKILGDEKFGNDKEKKAEFYYVVKSLGQGKSPEEMLKIANDQLKDVVTSPGWLWDSKEPRYSVEKNKMDANNAVWGSLHEDVGKDTVNAIGSGLLLKGAKSWGASDVDSFAKEFGGMDAIKKGTPANNAINSLKSKGQAVTIDNVKAVLKARPDGNY